MDENVYDVIIIGGGPAGLTAAQYTARLNIKTIVLDKSHTAGALAFTNKIENYPGVLQSLTGSELLGIFRQQAVNFGAEYVEAQVIGANLEGDIKQVFTMEKTYEGKTVIIATGSMGRKPSIKGEKEFLGRGVSYCAICDAAFYRNKEVCVVGESEEAIKETGVLARVTGQVSLISPTNKVKVEEHHTLVEHNVDVLLNYKVAEIRGSDVVEGILMVNKDTNEEIYKPMDGVFVYLHGSKPIVDFLNFAVDISDEECVLTDRMMETNIPGVFAAGDVSCVEVRQVVIAAANGCVAALSADKYIHHRKKRKYVWG
ncbi:MAG: FAD-dependent oxidoreductase [Nitrospirae bacterium]|nr:FAD-dependent oxidoreductase [Nitrospirota bacterium]